MPRNSEEQARGEKHRGKYCRRARQKIRRAPSRHEAAAAHAKRPAFRPLQKDDDDHGRGDHDMNDEKQRGHFDLPKERGEEIFAIHDRNSRRDQDAKGTQRGSTLRRRISKGRLDGLTGIFLVRLRLWGFDRGLVRHR